MLSVATDVLIESAEIDVNRDVEKLGKPQETQVQLVSWSPLKTTSGILRHLV